MSYVTKEATWPATTLQKGVKEVIARFYELADSKEPDAGPRIANEVFTKGATLVSVSGTFQGFSGKYVKDARVLLSYFPGRCSKSSK